MTVAIIVACSRNGVIGKDNTLPWYLPEDLKHFKAVTMGKPMIMGRKTFDSIGRPLPGRTTIVVTRQPNWTTEGVEVCSSLEDAFVRARECLTPENNEIMVVGGEEVYRQSLAQVDRVYFTEVDTEVEGDAYFPRLPEEEWAIFCREEHYSETAGLNYAFVVKGRK